MRLDKYLKVSRLIKRRTVANEACDNGRISVNGRVVKASYDVKVGDKIEISMGTRTVAVEVLLVADNVRKDDAAAMYKEVQKRGCCKPQQPRFPMYNVRRQISYSGAAASPPLWGGCPRRGRERCGTMFRFSFALRRKRTAVTPLPSRLRRATFPNGEGSLSSVNYNFLLYRPVPEGGSRHLKKTVKAYRKKQFLYLLLPPFVLLCIW